MRLKIVSDGTPVGTKIVDAETGKPIDNTVTKVTWVMDAGKTGTVITIETPDIPVELVEAVGAQVFLLNKKESEAKHAGIPLMGRYNCVCGCWIMLPPTFTEENPYVCEGWIQGGGGAKKTCGRLHYWENGKIMWEEPADG